jgi:hypothetical protein
LNGVCDVIRYFNIGLASNIKSIIKILM